MRLYLDNCCFNRPYDDQSQLKVYLESQAKLQVQADILSGKHELIWSFILEYENSANPFDVRKDSIEEWKDVAKSVVLLSDPIYRNAEKLYPKGIKKKDAFHIACAIAGQCDVFLTTDKKLLSTPIPDIKIMNPIQFICEMEELS